MSFANIIDSPADIAGNNSAPWCASGIGPGTLISTTDGDLPVEWLASGDRVITRRDGAQPLRWVGRNAIGCDQLAAHPGLRPITISKNGITQGAPDHPLVLSGQHRIFLSGADVQYYFGHDGALATAQDLTAQASDHDRKTDFTCFNLLFDAHQVIRANGIWVESLLLPDTPHQIGRRPGAIRHKHTAYPCLNQLEVRFLITLRTRTPLSRHRRAA